MADSKAHRIDFLTEADLPAVGVLLARCLIHDELPPALLRDRLFTDPDQRPEHRLCVRALDGALAGVAVGVARVHSNGAVGHVRLVSVHPDHSGRGIATALLDALEGRLIAAGSARLAVGGEVPLWLLAGVDVRYSAALCLFQRRGYTRTRDVFNLEVDLTRREFDSGPVEAELAQHRVTIARMAPSDRAELEAYLTANWSPTWRIEGLAALDFDPPSGFIARHRSDGSDAIVGFAVNDIARPGWFGPIGTDEGLRGLGVGTALLLRCMRAWQDAGRTHGEINWIGPLRFYVRAIDATVCRVIWQMGKEVK